MELSICISTWNRCGDLSCAIDSVLRQDYICNGDDWEIIVVDNCSTDNTVKYLQSLKHRLGDKLTYKVMDHSKYTAMQTLNLSFKMSSGKYILVMDDDAYFKDDNALTQLIKIAKYNYNFGVIGTNVQFEFVQNGGMFQMPIRNYDGSFCSSEEIKQFPEYINYFEFHGACALFNNEALTKVNYYDESFGIYINEWDLSCKFLNEHYNVSFAPHVIVKHKEYTYKKCNKWSMNYIRNYNTVLTRLINGRLNRIKMVTIRIPMLYVMHLSNTFKYCGKFAVLKYSVEFFIEYVRALYRCIFPDKRYDSGILSNIFAYKHIIEQSLYNSYKKSIIRYINGDKRIWKR